MEYNLEKYLWKNVKVKMDRPMWSKHPKHWFIYPINYWYIEWTLSPDGEEIDAYILWEFKPLEDFEWKVIAIIDRKNDVEQKLVVSNKNYTKEQIYALVEFQERFFDVEIIV